jgi:hypothetical protein
MQYKSVLIYRTEKQLNKATLQTIASADFVGYCDEDNGGVVVTKDRYNNQHRTIPFEELRMIFDD